MKVLVTGGLGHLGSKLLRELSMIKKIELVRVLDNLSSQRFPSLFDLPKNIQYEFIEGDVRRRDDINLAMKNIDVVYHLAAITDAVSSFRNQKITRSVNYLATKKVIKGAIRANVGRLIYPSTTSVYGPINDVAKEDCRLEEYKPASPYGKYKLLGESEVLAGYKKNGLDVTVLRLGTVYGPSIGMRFHTAVNKFVFQACNGLPLTVWTNAIDQKRPYLHIDDAMSIFKFMFEKGRGTGEVYNVLSQNATVREVIEIINQFIVGLKINYTESPMINQLSFYTDDTKIRKLGFKPQGNLNNGIGRTIMILNGIISKKSFQMDSFLKIENN